MKMRLTPPTAPPGAWRVAGRSAAGAVLLAVTVSACTGGSSSVPSIFTPSPSTSGQSASQPGTRTPSPAGGSSRSADASPTSSPHTSISSRPPVSPTATPTHTAAAPTHTAAAPTHTAAAPTHTAAATPTAAPTHTATPAHTSAPASTAFPTAAPETGGGGTAGLQDGLLFGVGGAAVLAGFGTFAWRTRLRRKFGLGAPATRNSADREPADR